MEKNNIMSEFFGLKLLKSGGEKIKKNALWFQNLIMKIYVNKQEKVLKIILYSL